ncbi:hypothetical protein SVXHr_2335 [Halorhabdus sp. SVX81]|uniref:hypothetical protein n=1 Tax=Halorhabdus sp. SVX81 TaxID=2978283 RepID=UPI0023DA5774|nr:hypothetical protein [Halorhabdus sp. SVX81]WEL18485.1 hypothetical protein SVXHr_2335 [Halorhabdus sp. SVX81]
MAGISTGITLSIAGCGSEEPETEGGDIQDSDGDGVIDSEDYAPRDPDVQRESDVQSGDSPTTGGEEDVESPGNSTPSQTQSPADVTYPSHSGVHTISARDNFWAWEFSVNAEFILEYRAINQLDENYDFDVLLYTATDFEEYRAIANEVTEGVRPEYLDGSAPGVESGVEATDIQLPAGTYYLVIDNTDLSDAGDWGTEETRRVKLEATTKSV